MIKPIAIHLPQFHPFAENDEWWGKGFTEWTNVTRARPQFPGHYQPHLPADLGFYDLRLKESRDAQVELARQYGIHGFCYYHYWFNGKRLMHEPLDRMLREDKTEFPFMFCWANENWTRRWDGQEAEVLIRQEYSEEDDINHINFLIENVFNDPRYIRVDGRPVFLVYRPSLFPDIRSTLRTWRRLAHENGAGELYIGYVQGFEFKEEPKSLGFDFAIEYQPDSAQFPKTIQPSVREKIFRKTGIADSVHYRHTIMSYADFVSRQLTLSTKPKNVYKTVCPMWDNTARRKEKGLILHGSSPELYSKWLKHAAEQTIKADEPGGFLFINAWNEWAEGNHLEPCLKFGRAYLEATLSVIKQYA